MTKKNLLKTLDKLENTFASLRGFIDEIYSEKERLSQDQAENVRTREQIISGQKKVLLDLEKAKKDIKLIEKRKEALKSERADIDQIISGNDKREADLEKKSKELDEKIEVSGNLSNLTELLSDKEQLLKVSQAKLRAKRREFEEEKKRVKQKGAENSNYEISLGRREKLLEVAEARVEKILGNV
ncbi:MAG: hypothetical protein GY861_03185 [bacterium]|nr:hypothetical protein [bacterium]